jgi:hypothetical protein
MSAGLRDSDVDEHPGVPAASCWAYLPGPSQLCAEGQVCRPGWISPPS